MSIKVTCSMCSNNFFVAPSRFKSRSRFFCSKKCEASFRKAKDTIVCSICKKKFHVKPFRIRRLKDEKNICCSKKCSNILKQTLFLGKNNHQYGLKGELNSSFKSDFKISTYGYIEVRNINHPFSRAHGFMFFHRIIVEQYLRDNYPDSDFLIEVDGYNELFLDPEIVIHHKDENKLNNTILNLEIMTRGDHQSLHNFKRIDGYIRDENNRFVKMIGEKKKNNNVNLIKKHIEDAGLDVISSENCIIKSRNSELISTDLFIAIPNNHVGLLWSRSGLSVNHKIEVGAGCIDSTYRGHVKVHLYNNGDKDYVVNIGDKIAQLLTIPINIYNYKEVDRLDETDRGNGGFGSTGK